MNEEITIEQQLQDELSRLKRAVEYIEQAEKNIQLAQELNKDNQSKFEVVIKSNENLKNEINTQITATSKRFEQITHELNKLTTIISKQNKRIEENHQEIERIKSLKWYQKLFN